MDRQGCRTRVIGGGKAGGAYILCGGGEGRKGRGEEKVQRLDERRKEGKAGRKRERQGRVRQSGRRG